MESTELAFHTCPCTGVYDQRQVEVRMPIGGSARVFTDIPQGACPICGSRVYKGHVLERLEALFAQSDLAGSGASGR